MCNMYRCCIVLVAAAVCCCCQSDSFLHSSVLRELMKEARPQGVALRDVNGFYWNHIREKMPQESADDYALFLIDYLGARAARDETTISYSERWTAAYNYNRCCLFCKCEPSFRHREELLRNMETYSVRYKRDFHN